MTITLHWWCVPLLILIASIVVGIWPTSESGMFAGLGKVLLAMVGMLFALAMFIGHFI